MIANTRSRQENTANVTTMELIARREGPDYKNIRTFIKVGILNGAIILY
jgi:hypothetical protein